MYVGGISATATDDAQNSIVNKQPWGRMLINL